MPRSDGVTGIAPRDPSTPPDVRFSASGGWISGNGCPLWRRASRHLRAFRDWFHQPVASANHGRPTFVRYPVVSDDYATSQPRICFLHPLALRSCRRYEASPVSSASILAMCGVRRSGAGCGRGARPHLPRTWRARFFAPPLPGGFAASAGAHCHRRDVLRDRRWDLPNYKDRATEISPRRPPGSAALSRPGQVQGHCPP